MLQRRDEGGVAWLTLDRPEARNALSAGLMTAVEGALAEIAGDRGVRAVVIGGAGAAFCAGHDLKELRGADEAGLRAIFAQCGRMMQAIVALPVPVIAAVHGVATAAGCQLVATCDLVVAGEGARFATPGVNIGLFCSTPMVALSRAVGRKAALEMLLTGEAIDAGEARRIGLVNRVVPDGEVAAAAGALAAVVASKSRAVVGMGKAAFQAQGEMGLAEAYAYCAGVMVRNMGEADAGEGIDAFIGKRAPVWRG